MTILPRLLLAICLVVLVPTTAAGQALPAGVEAIERFDSRIVVDTDGAVTITETIDVIAQGNKIRRGLFRQIPVIRDGIGGARVASQLTVLSVSRDGHDEPFRVVEGGGMVQVRIGSETVDVAHGQHRYTLSYRMTRAVDFLDKQDQLYWNVTGNAWSLVIRKTSALVMLPEGALIQSVGIREGASGSAERTPAVGNPRTHAARFGTNLNGLTIRIDFDKGAVIAPTGKDARALWLADFHHLLMPVVGLLVLLLALLVVWLATANRRPLPRQAGMQDVPPDGLSPVQCHAIQHMGFTWNGWAALTAGLLELARKRCITLDLASVPQRITVLAGPSSEALPPEELAILDQLRKRGPDLLIDSGDGAAFLMAKIEMQRATHGALGDRYFRQSPLAICLCIALYVAMLVFLGFAGLDMRAPAIVGILFLGGVPALTCIILDGIRRHLRRRILILWATVLLVGIGLLVAGLFGHGMLNATALAIALGLHATAVTAIAQAGYTPKGREAAVRIRGFRAWLAAGGTVDDARFEDYLPYAIALDAEAQWAARLGSDLMATVARDVSQLQEPMNRRGVGEPLSGTVLASALIAASPRSASSGSSGSGGSSGGGGGGGGGGGW